MRRDASSFWRVHGPLKSTGTRALRAAAAVNGGVSFPEVICRENVRQPNVILFRVLLAGTLPWPAGRARLMPTRSCLGTRKSRPKQPPPMLFSPSVVYPFQTVSAESLLSAAFVICNARLSPGLKAAFSSFTNHPLIPGKDAVDFDGARISLRVLRGTI